jgi:outer membrane biosynthesis protein TonB
MIEPLLAAERALSVGLLDRAENLYRQVAAADPLNSIAVVGLARVALDRGDEDRALELSRRALAIDPENAAAVRMVARLEEVMVFRGDEVPLPRDGVWAEPEPEPEPEPELEAPEPEPEAEVEVEAPEPDIEAPPTPVERESTRSPEARPRVPLTAEGEPPIPAGTASPEATTAARPPAPQREPERTEPMTPDRGAAHQAASVSSVRSLIDRLFRRSG